MINIRHYMTKDYPMLEGWWKETGAPASPINVLPLETTFIMEMNNVPASCLSIFFTNCSELSYLGNFISNPALKGKERQEANKEFIKFITSFAKDCGFKRVLAFAKEEKLKTHYETLGMRKTCSNLDSFVLEGN